MICPACHKSQTETGPECGHCGVIFEKWQAKMNRESGLSEPPVQAPPSAPAAEIPLPDFTRIQPILETNSAEVLAFRVDGQIRTLFGLLMFFIDPAVRFLYRLLSKFLAVSPYFAMSILCVLAGVSAGMVARRRGYSEILTAGGAGFLGGILRFAGIYLMTEGPFSIRFQSALPVFAIYSSCAFAGGVIAWALRKFVDVKLE